MQVDHHSITISVKSSSSFRQRFWAGIYGLMRTRAPTRAFGDDGANEALLAWSVSETYRIPPAGYPLRHSGNAFRPESIV